MHLYSLCQTWLNLKIHTVCETYHHKGGGGWLEHTRDARAGGKLVLGGASVLQLRVLKSPIKTIKRVLWSPLRHKIVFTPEGENRRSYASDELQTIWKQNTQHFLSPVGYS